MGDGGDATEKQKLVRLIHDLVLQRVADAYGLAGLTLPRLLKNNKQSKFNPLLAGSLESLLLALKKMRRPLIAATILTSITEWDDP